MNAALRPNMPARNALLLGGIGASGAAALIYEVVWQRVLSNTVGGSVYSLSILLAAFMAGLAIGGRWGGRHLREQADHVKIFGLIQLALGVCGVAVYGLINNLSPVYAGMFYSLHDSFGIFTVAQMALLFMVLVIPTTLMGATFPIVVAAWSLRQEEIGVTAGDVYSINTWGAVVGSLVAGFILIPLAGLQIANICAVAVNLVLAVLAFAISGTRRLAVFALAALALLPSVALIENPGGISFSYANADHFASYDEYKSINTNLTSLFNKEGAYGRVQVFETRPPRPGTRPIKMLLNGARFEGSTGTDIMSMQTLAYLPLAIHKKPTSILNIGLGTGATLAAVKEDRRVKYLEVVEINPMIFEAVEEAFYPGLFKEKRMSRISDDARHYLTNTPKKFDIIISQPSYPTRKSTAHLFTREFYDIARNKLHKDGVFAQWLPSYLLSNKDGLTAIKTLRAVFPRTYVWQHGATDMFLIGLTSGQELDPTEIGARVKAYNSSAAEGLMFGSGPDRIAELTNDRALPINTDDLPYIEFSSARNKVTGVRGTAPKD